MDLAAEPEDVAKLAPVDLCGLAPAGAGARPPGAR